MDTEKLKLLIIDDDEDLIELVKVKLKRGIQVFFEMQGSHALKAIEEVLPDIILLDLNMPNIDGYEVLNIIFSHPKYSSIPVVCASADAAEERRSRVYLMGAVGFITKPYDMNALEKDLLNIYHSTVIEMSDLKNQRYFHLTHNTHQKQKLINEFIIRKVTNQEKVIYISWGRGESVINPSLLVHLDSQLIYLQVRPSLITRFQFLQDLSGIFDDIISLVSDNCRNYIFVFDDPTYLFANRDSDVSASKIFTFADLASFYFKEVHFFVSKSKEKHVEDAISSMSKIFVES